MKTMKNVSYAAFFAVVLLIMAQALWAALIVHINGPSQIWVPYGQCVSASWSAGANMAVSTYSWTWDSQQVSTSSGYGRTFCSPELDYATAELSTLGLYATGGGYGVYVSKSVNVIYEAGNENGGCGTQIICWP